ncbi:MAG: hypothetical protein MO847_10910, partial [Candidatus Protistobacter heckmanni]|nr:hypothetical protein [Candidatus Protistobacter heckmanni]
YLRFGGVPDTSAGSIDTEKLALTPDSTARGVAVQINELATPTAALTIIGGETAHVTVAGDGTTSIPLLARYIHTGAITPATANASLPLDIITE